MNFLTESKYQPTFLQLALQRANEVALRAHVESGSSDPDFYPSIDIRFPVLNYSLFRTRLTRLRSDAATFRWGRK